MEHENDLEYDYDCFDDAPLRHRQIANFAASEVLSPDVIAYNVKCDIQTVRKVLSHKPIREELDRRKEMQIYGVLESFDVMSEIRQVGLEKLLQRMRNDELSDTNLMKAISLAADRHPDRAMLQQQKMINESGKGKAGAGELSDLRERAVKNMLPFDRNPENQSKPIKQAEKVENE